MLYCCIWNIEDVDNANKVEVNWLETKLWIEF